MAFPTQPMHGKLAAVTLSGTKIDYSSRWSINWVKDAAVFGRQGKEYKEAYPGQYSWSGSAEFIFVNSSEQQSLIKMAITTDATVALTTGVTSSNICFCFDSTVNRLKGNIIITGLTVDAPVGDLIRASFTFQGSGALIQLDA